jgi:hypothetical protein
MIMAECETAVQFKDDGYTIDTVEHGEWYVSDTSEAYCEYCNWQGVYADCKEPDDMSQGGETLP